MSRYWFLALMTLAACDDCEDKRPAIATQGTDNTAVVVDRLFTAGGCTVYRFEDHFRPHYFANCGSGTSSESERTQSQGKTTTQVPDVVTWNDRP